VKGMKFRKVVSSALRHVLRIHFVNVGFYLLAIFYRQKGYHIRDFVFPEDFKNNIARILIKRKERVEQGQMCNVFVKEGKNLVNKIF